VVSITGVVLEHLIETLFMNGKWELVILAMNNIYRSLLVITLPTL
jgi:hypothetical protein